MKSKNFWYFLMFGAVVLWAAVLCIAVLVPSASAAAWIFFILLVILHIAEYPLVTAKLGKDRGLTPGSIFIKTFLFGFTWWLPLKKGIIEK